MAKIEVERFFCKGCGLCMDVCPFGLIVWSKEASESGLYVEQQDSTKCTGCKLCAVMCPECAISVYR